MKKLGSMVLMIYRRSVRDELTYVEEVLSVEGPLSKGDVREVLSEAGLVLYLLLDVLSRQLVKVGHVNHLHLTVLEYLFPPVCKSTHELHWALVDGW